jgi:hypothetical protein
MAKTVLFLHLDHVSGQWAYHHLGEYKKQSVYKPMLRKALDLMMEPRPDDWKKHKYHTENQVVITLPHQVRPLHSSTRYRHYWIPPDKMKVLNQFFDKWWRNELLMDSFVAKQIDENAKETDVINAFFGKYDISSDELLDDACIKMLQRAREKHFELMRAHL